MQSALTLHPSRVAAAIAGTLSLALSLGPLGGSAHGTSARRLARHNTVVASGTASIEVSLTRPARLTAHARDGRDRGRNRAIRMESRAAFYGFGVVREGDGPTGYAVFAHVEACDDASCPTHAINSRHILGFRMRRGAIVLTPGTYRLVVFGPEDAVTKISFDLEGALAGRARLAARTEVASDVQTLDVFETDDGTLAAHADFAAPSGGLFLSTRWMRSGDLAGAEWGDCLYRGRSDLPRDVKAGRGCATIARSGGGAAGGGSFPTTPGAGSEFTYNSLRIVADGGIDGVRSYGAWFHDEDATAFGGHAAYLGI